MSEILDLIGQQLDGGTVQNLASQIGATPQQTTAAVQTALPALLAALQGNASTSGGSASLLSALDRDHDGSILDDVAGFFGQGPSPSAARSVGHIFGERQEPVANAVAQRSGLDASQVMRLLAMLAPLVLGALSRARQQRGGAAGGGLAPGGGAGQGGGGLGDLLGAALGGLRQRQQGSSGSSGGLGDILGGLLGGGGGAGGGSAINDVLEGLGGGPREDDRQETGRQGDPLGDLLGGLLGPRR